MSLRHEVRLAAVALQFLTRVPVRLDRFEPDWLNACVRHFPLVGAGVGGAVAAVLWGAGQWWPPAVAALLALALGVALTGGFHEDGLADTFDALGGVVPRERALAIMKDSRIGSYGALALALSLGLRAALLASLLAGSALALVVAVVASHALARTAAVAVMVALPYGGDADHAKAKPLATAVPAGLLAVALAWSAAGSGLALALGTPWMPLAAAWAAAAGVALIVGRWLRRRLGGYTGDGLGATEQLAEIAVLLAWLAVAP
jgi:adenosylcobinamide-GDP ribazoletransferase